MLTLVMYFIYSFFDLPFTLLTLTIAGEQRGLPAVPLHPVLRDREPAARLQDTPDILQAGSAGK